MVEVTDNKKGAPESFWARPHGNRSTDFLQFTAHEFSYIINHSGNKCNPVRSEMPKTLDFKTIPEVSTFFFEGTAFGVSIILV